MLYYLFTYLEQIDIPGAGLFQYITFRTVMSVIISLVISLLFGKKLIKIIKRKQVNETIRHLGLDGETAKEGTPTMGGIIILGSIIIPTLLFADLTNVYVILMLITTVWLGLIGFTDDYIKTFKHDKKGLAGKLKILAQVILGVVVGLTLYLSDDVVIREKIKDKDQIPKTEQKIIEVSQGAQKRVFYTSDSKSTKTTIPFFKNNEGDYANLVAFLGEEKAQKWAWVVFVIVVIFIIAAVSNGANVTDGLDGLCTGTSAIIGATLGVFAYLSGNIIYSDYLNIMYIPFTGELVVFMGAFIGATIGFLWYNSYPAQVFMGDTGSLSIGGIIAVFAIIIRKELLIPILCGIFLMESLSVIMQVSWFKYTKKKYGAGRRIFKMSPLHHHYQKIGYPEPKIVMRFIIIGILLAVLTIATLKIR
jgi:phospho-N-acetylmuramoyl-pentapeptide-transferase